MAQNISLWGNTYSNCPAIKLPKQGGGTAQFDDTADANAAAGDIASGKTAYVNGVKVTGTASGGGGSGLDYETGVYTPNANTANPTITFTKTHTGRPIFVLIADASSGAPSTSNMCYWGIFNWYDAFGVSLYASSSSRQYARVQYGYKSSSSISVNGSNLTSTTALGNAISSTGFVTNNSTSYVFKSGRSYNWIAVWKPTS